jgi:ribosomal protein L34E
MTAIVECPNCGKKNRVPDSAAGTPRCGNCHKPLPWVADAGDDDFVDVVESRRDRGPPPYGGIACPRSDLFDTAPVRQLQLLLIPSVASVAECEALAVAGASAFGGRPPLPAGGTVDLESLSIEHFGRQLAPAEH